MEQTQNRIEIKQLVRASRLHRRNGLYRVRCDGKDIGFFEKTYYTADLYRVEMRKGDPHSIQVFSSYKAVVNFLLKNQ